MPEPGPGVARVARVRLGEAGVVEIEVAGGKVQGLVEDVDLGSHRVTGADVDRRPDRTSERRVGAGPRNDPVEVHGVEEGDLLQVGEQGDVMAGGAEVERELDALREAAIGVVVVARRQGDLLEVVGALHAPGGLTSCWTAGSSSPIRTAMIAMTTRSSISVKPRRTERDCRGGYMAVSFYLSRRGPAAG